MSAAAAPEPLFISAGYFLAQRAPGVRGGRGAITLSTCLAAVLPELWPSPVAPGLRPAPDKLELLGISPADADRAEEWGRARCDARAEEWPLPFADLATLREFAARFTAPRDGVLLLGAALPADLVEAFLEVSRSAGDACERGHAVRRALAPEPGGALLGYEILGNGASESHSIHCTSGEEKLQSLLGIALDEDGLASTLADARRAADWASDGHAEPVRYFPWRLTRYARDEGGERRGAAG